MEKIDKTPISRVLEERILVLDGAMGTQIQKFNLKESDYGQPEYYGCNEYLNICHPEIIVDIHNHYFDVGADIIESNSFGANSLVLAEYGLADRAYEIAKAAGELACRSANHFTTAVRPRYAAGSVGPTNKLLNLGSNISFSELKNSYKIQISGLIDGGVDLILLETFPDTSNLKAAGIAWQEVCAEKKVTIPLMISVTIEKNGFMLAGQKIEALYHSIKHFKPLSVGINCGLGASDMAVHLKALSEICGCFVSAHPNAGLPDENGVYQESAADFAYIVRSMAEKKYLNIVGGCCGTTPDHIALLAESLQKTEPRKPIFKLASIASGMEIQEFSSENRPVIVGERSNMTGSLKFRKLIRGNKFEEAAEIAKIQVGKGAQVIDINLSDTETDELLNIQKLYPLVLKKIKTPVMIDSAGNFEVFNTALQFIQGKSIINSVNLENATRFEKISNLAKSYGAMILAVLIDENGMATTAERKLEVATKMYNLLTNKFGISEEDIIFDCLVFPVATGDANYFLGAKYTMEAIELIKKKYPRCKTSLGVSNCSFGLPEAGREALNSSYLYHATKAGLDMAIVNSEKIVRYTSLTAEEKLLCSLLLFDNTEANVKKFVAYYSGKKAQSLSDSVDTDKLSAEEKLAYYLQEGLKTGLEDSLKIAMQSRRALAVVNEVLMPAMGEVGRRFNANELTVIEVLQSAEVMKTAVDFLKPFMAKNETSAKGKMVLATVKGDVHDIGKNLVDIVLSNNGYEIIDIGIKIDSDALIEAVKRLKPDVIGLSGLLVKSAQQMITTAEDLKNAGINIPIFVGGAALSAKFALTRIQAVYDGTIIYAKDAVDALGLMDRYFNPKTQKDFLDQINNEKLKFATIETEQLKPKVEEAPTVKPLIFKVKTETVVKAPETIPEPIAVPTPIVKIPVVEVPIVENVPIVEIPTVEKAPEIETPPVEKIVTPQAPDNYSLFMPIPPDHRHKVLDRIDLDQILPFINKQMLYSKHFGLKGNYATKLAEGGEQVLKITAEVNDVINYSRENNLFDIKAVYRFYKVRKHENSIEVLDRHGMIDAVYDFPRQQSGEMLCLTDFLEKEDYICFFVVTAGAKPLEVAALWKEEGNFAHSHILAALSLQVAEAAAEYLHKKIRQEWKIDLNETDNIGQILAGEYRGKRFSFGYATCPDLNQQSRLFKMLSVTQSIGVELTEGMVMSPEDSISAMVFHSKNARYFQAK